MTLKQESVAHATKYLQITVCMIKKHHKLFFSWILSFFMHSSATSGIKILRVRERSMAKVFLPPPSPSPSFLLPPLFLDVPPTSNPNIISDFQHYIYLLPAYISNSTLAPSSTKDICGDIPFPIDEGYWNCFHTHHFAKFPQDFEFFYNFVRDTELEIPCDCGIKNPFYATNCGTFNLEERIGVDVAFINCVIRKFLFPSEVMPYSTALVPTENGIELENGSTRQDNLTTVKLIFQEKLGIDESKSTSIAQTITASVSFISSIAIICIIQRSHTGFASTSNRLLLGLSIADIISSFWLMMSTALSPSYTSGYIWNPRGNVHTCDTQGFFLFLGIIGAPLYNCSLCFYYLAVIKFNKKDKFIRKKLEPYFHVVPILVSLIGAITILSKESFNANGSYCWINTDPPYCGVEVPCKRGKDAMVLFSIFAIAPFIALPIVVIVTMIFVYREAIKNEKKISKYGVGSLRRNVGSNSSIDMLHGDSNNNTTVSNRWSSLKCWSKASASKSNTAKWQSRTILHKAISYSMAYLLTYLFPFVTSVQYWAGYQSSSTLKILVCVFLPLQGFFNFLVFMFFRVMNARRTKKLSWCQSFTIAIKSRGENKERGSLAAGGASGKSTRRMIKNATKENSIINSTTATAVTPRKAARKKHSRNVEEEEEEKVEIENSLPRLQFDGGQNVSSLEKDSCVKDSLIDSSIPQDRQHSHLDDVVSESKTASKNRVPTTTTATTPTRKQSPSASGVSSSVSSDKADMPRERMKLDMEKGSHDQKLVDINDKAEEDECNVDLRDESDIETGLALLRKSTKPFSLHGDF